MVNLCNCENKCKGKSQSWRRIIRFGMKWRQDGFRSDIFSKNNAYFFREFFSLSLSINVFYIFEKFKSIFNEFRYFLHLVENFLR